MVQWVSYASNGTVSMVQNQWFSIIDSVSLVQYHWFSINGTVSVVQYQWFSIIGSVVQYHWFSINGTVSMVQYQRFSIIGLVCIKYFWSLTMFSVFVDNFWLRYLKKQYFLSPSSLSTEHLSIYCIIKNYRFLP